METLLPVIERGFVLFSTISVFIILLANGYFYIRKKFPVRVNCWFCDVNTRVPYENANSFICPSCLQYNGFNEDGSYNKDIPEQYSCKRNSRSPAVKQSPKPSNNGLCHLCNINQDLKVKQLATFVPVSEKNFDHEIEEYEKKLEQAYKLCTKCQIVLKITLSVQNSWLFGQTMSYFHKARKSGSTLLNLNVSSHGMTIDRKRSFVIRMMQLIQILLACFIIRNNTFVKTLLENVSLNCDISLHMPESASNHFEEIGTLMKNVLNMTEAYLQNNTSEYLSDTFLSGRYHSAKLATIGLFAQCILLIWHDIKASKKKTTIAWIGLAMLSWLPHSQIFHPYVQVVQTQLVAFVMNAIIFEKLLFPKQRVKMIKKKVRPSTTPVKSFGEYSDDDIENVSYPSKNSSNSSSTPKKTHLSKVERESIVSSVLHKLTGNNETDSSFDTRVPHPTVNPSFNNLHLNSTSRRFKQFTKPVVSPAKFTATANVLTANTAVNNLVNLSRSSSSGYDSHMTDNETLKQNSVPNSRKNSLSDESDKSSSSELRNLFSNQNDSEQGKLYDSTECIFGLKGVSPVSNQQNFSTRCKSEQFGQTNFGNNIATCRLNNRLNSQFNYHPSYDNHPTCARPSAFTGRNQSPEKRNIVHRKNNIFVPNLNQNSMLYIQVNKNQDIPLSARPLDCDYPLINGAESRFYGSRLFNMEALNKFSQLSIQKNELGKTYHVE